MADEYFTFGDEDLDGAAEANGSFAPTVALVDRIEDPSALEDEHPSTAERAARPRGDSRSGSSERRGPSVRRTRLLVGGAVAILAVLVVRVASSAFDGAGAADPGRDMVSESRNVAEPITPSPPGALSAEELRASRERAAERQRVRRQRAKTRRRARRRRERRVAQRERRAEKQATSREANAASQPEPTEYIPPTPEAAPETAPAPEPSPPPSDEGGLQDGASSPEFGL